MNPTYLAPPSEIILFETADGKTQVDVRLKDHMAWLSQAQMAVLYQTSPQNISMHLKAIFQEGELAEKATCKDFLQVRTEGNRSILTMLHASASPEGMNLPGFRLHQLKGDRKGSWAVSVSGNGRIVFTFHGGDATDVDLVDYH
ncbi:MAG: type II toxin-antitoxin system RelE/ParE family toxin [Desulfovibrionaceae bacterium]|nr:type II toxin-antitoxin system RelE/ParE family toxin [Desulfovibrionaceae bacterium]